MTPVEPRSATPAELPARSDLCLRSRAHRGCDAAFPEARRAELAPTEDGVRATSLRVADRGCGACGLGRMPFRAGAAAARARGARRLTVEADPDAVGFHEPMRARVTGAVPSGPAPGRRLPRLDLAMIPR